MMSGTERKVDMADIRKITEFRGKRKSPTRVETTHRHPSESPLAKIINLDDYRPKTDAPTRPGTAGLSREISEALKARPPAKRIVP